MNKQWSEQFKSIQNTIGKKDTFECGITDLLKLRQELIDTLLKMRSELIGTQFSESPFMNTQGYHNKTIAYSIWHIFRIEDIVANSVARNNEQIFFALDFRRRINANISTTGNELIKQQIVDFSRELNIDELYNYALQVKENTDKFFTELTFSELRSTPNGNRENLVNISVSKDAEWLIDYWFNKDIKGLILMPFSRHWIMHIEAALRIKNKIML